MKKISAFVLVFVLLAVYAPLTAFAEVMSPLCVNINGRRFEFEGGQSAVSLNGIALIPVGEIFSELNFRVEWDPDTATATLRRGPTTVVITEGSLNFTVNGIARSLRAPAIIINDRLMASFSELIGSIDGRTYLDAHGVIHIHITERFAPGRAPTTVCVGDC